MNEAWGIWLVMALIATSLWALTSLLDVYFVHDVYRDELDGTLISSAFQLLPWVLVLTGSLDVPSLQQQACLLAVCAGVFTMASNYCYFRALFKFDDSTLTYVLWDTSVLLVPFLAWLWSDEQLLAEHYGGIGLAFIGSIIFLSLGGTFRQGLRRILVVMTIAILLSSVSTLLLKESYRLAEGRFIEVFLMFCLGGGLVSILIAVTQPQKTAARIQRYLDLSPSIIALAIAAEALALGGEVAINRALDLSPSPSFVPAVETSHTPIMMLFSAVLSILLERNGNAKIATVFGGQVTHWKGKLFAMLLMSAGVVLISQ